MARSASAAFQQRLSSLIRNACVDDATAMAVIDAAVSYTPWSEKQFMAACTGGSGTSEFAAIAEYNSQLLGFVVCQAVFDELSILNVAVSPQAQRRGIASALIAQILSAPPEGVRRCLLDVRESNIAARALYSKMGFAEDGVRRNYYTAPRGREDAVLMSLSTGGWKSGQNREDE